jgi:PAS domain S-box-containing protein
MNNNIFIGLIQNAALLLSLGLIYDIFYRRKRLSHPVLYKITSGLIIGGMAIVLMLTPVKLESGIIFDTRTIILGLAGLFFGTIPVILAMAIAGAYRLSLGGGGALTGIATIISSGLIGLLWRHYRFRESKQLSLSELYLFGGVVHAVMILCMFLLPQAVVEKTIRTLILPVILIYPLCTALLGNLLTGRLQRHRIEEELQKGEEEYRKLSNEQQIILNTVPVGIALVNNRKVVWANPAHCKLFGYEVGSTYNMDTEKLYADKESYEYIGKMGNLNFKSGGIVSEDAIMQKKDGSLICCNLIGQAINPKNLEEGAIWIVLDITERRQAEEERQQLELQFHQAQKLESLGVLAGGIAHDFNNILTVIIGHCYMAKENFIPEQEYKATFQKVETAANRAANLCRQMLTYAGKSPMEQTQINLWLLMDEVVNMLQAAIKKNVTIELDLKRDIPEIRGDTGQIQQVIMNLIINASEAIGDNNGTIRVVLTKMIIEAETDNDTSGTVIPAGRYVCLEVTDTGCGMDEITKKRIFEPFFTTKFTGRGLGMSAIQGIIKSHEGVLHLTSKPGVGTTFKVFFPVSKTHDRAKATLTAADRLEDASGAILLVEDEDILRIMGKELLEALGFTAMTASNGSEALEIYRERCSEIDVILLDLIMPVMGGIETYHELRKISSTVPIIICSGYGVESVEEFLKNDPHAGFVHKPYKPEELRSVIMGMVKSEG